MTKAAGYSEVDAMRDVDGALTKLSTDTDAQRRVIQWVASKYAPGVPLPDVGQVKPTPPAINAARPEDIKSFMAQKRPANHYERVACLAYYLEKFKDKTDVAAKDIVEANTEARLPKMSNPGVFIKHATHTYGYLSSLGQRRLAVSSRGEAVVEALPDRAKLEEAHTNFPFGKKSRKKSRRKASSRND